MTENILTAKEVLERNVIDMAIGFTATMRAFEEGSNIAIAKLLTTYLAETKRANDQDAFDVVHENFCVSFTKIIRTAARRNPDGTTRAAKPASYGHAAKIFDVCAKVWFYYCHLPDHQTAAILVPLLHPAIDTPILKRLKFFSDHEIKATTISGIDRNCYIQLQALALQDRNNNYPQATDMVAYDDLVWSELNRK